MCIQSVAEGCAQLVYAGVRQISLADTVGLATPAQIADVAGAVLEAQCEAEVGVHLHAARGEAAPHIAAAYDAGCRRFDGALGGLGGCPFAQNQLVGNIPTEILIAVLQERGAQLPEFGNLNELIDASVEIAASAADET